MRYGGHGGYVVCESWGFNGEAQASEYQWSRKYGRGPQLWLSRSERTDLRPSLRVSASHLLTLDYWWHRSGNSLDASDPPSIILK